LFAGPGATSIEREGRRLCFNPSLQSVSNPAVYGPQQPMRTKRMSLKPVALRFDRNQHRAGRNYPASGTKAMSVQVKGPFDLTLSLAAAACFLPVARAPSVLTTAIDLDGNWVAVTVSQPAGRSSVVHASAIPSIEKASLQQIARWLVWSELDLRPFYELAAGNPIMGSVALSLNGLKPLRPATLFEMAIIAITEQQLSMAAAFHIRARLVNRFGARLGGLWRFPSAERLATASVQELNRCGLSRRKAE
jgi:HhH-GPD superfamily base excision DNA repair protein